MKMLILLKYYYNFYNFQHGVENLMLNVKNKVKNQLLQFLIISSTIERSFESFFIFLEVVSIAYFIVE